MKLSTYQQEMIKFNSKALVNTIWWLYHDEGVSVPELVVKFKEYKISKIEMKHIVSAKNKSIATKRAINMFMPR